MFWLLIVLGILPEPRTATLYTSRDDSPFTALGTRVRDNTLHAAYRDAPLRSKVRVRSLQTGRSVILDVDDFGPNAVEPDGSGPPDWRCVYANRRHQVWTPRENCMRGCRARPEGCRAPRGFRWRGDIDISRAGWYGLGLNPRQGRADVVIENVSR